MSCLGNIFKSGHNTKNPGDTSLSSGIMALSKIVDIHTLLEQYAWRHYTDFESIRSGMKWRNEFKGLERDDVHFELNVKHLLVQHEEPDYCNLNPTHAKPYTLFKTVFTNNTQRPQEYSFKTERTTESLCLLAREQGYTIGEQAELTLKTPCEIMEFKAGFKHEMSFAKATENSVSETLTWGVDSNISVPAHYQTTAELVVEEMSYAGQFSVTTRFTGRITIVLIRRKDGAIVIPVTANVTEIFRDLLADGNVSKDLKSMVTIEKDTVKLITKGQCSFQFAMKQKVEINEKPTSDLNDAKDNRSYIPINKY